MKQFKLLLLIIPLCFLSIRFKQLKLGDTAPLVKYKMQNVTAQQQSITDNMMPNGIVIIFTSNTCPFVVMYEQRYHQVKKWCNEQKVGMILVNSNADRRDSSDSFQSMKKHAKKQNYNFPYLLDKDSKLANAFGAQTTPHVFLLDKNYKLVYKGAIDNNAQSAQNVTKLYLKDAINALASNTNIQIKETPPVGCSIKRKISR